MESYPNSFGRYLTALCQVLVKVSMSRPYLIRSCQPLPYHIQTARRLTALYLSHGKPLKELTPHEAKLLVFSR